ncbi:hypothetical protein DACRYDRAFT_13620 [Dacryopinax primogenitus]|uniref:Uncharacterized protein n=1 Tax=Dacryopinax primogenitus (strain DJM 731) TaxID=1858805 RepID=M5G613_DACPD|nr:uncharacterized protein DACRYDRAFT_13620 [Dacryopinax primogenitus]EJU05691.1 hypothetical protein DACRYDRAFT_13620 [Dacryopinax primogenitus]
MQPRPPVASKDVGGGDDLGEDFDLDPDFSPPDAGAAEEEDGEEEGFQVEDDTFVPDPELDDGLRDVRSTRALKRKALGLDLDLEEGEGEVGGPEKKKRKKKPKEVDALDGEGREVLSPHGLERWWKEVLAKEGVAKGLSALELEEAALPEQCFEDTSAFNDPRTVENLPKFITEHVPKLAIRLAQRPKNPAAPTCLFLSPAALRAADVCRVLKASGLRGEKGGEVAKLFAKHFKLQQQADFLARTRVAVAVATPNRLHQLLEHDALGLSALSHIVLDSTWRDAKDRTLTSVPEVRTDVVALLRGPLGAKIREGNVRVVVY